MPIPFSRSVRSLNADGFRFSMLGLLLIALALGSWMAWFCWSRVALYEITNTARVVIDEARAKYEEAQAVARVGAEEAKRLTRLQTEGVISEMDAIRAQAEAQKRQAAADALRIAINRQGKDQQVKESDRQVQL